MAYVRFFHRKLPIKGDAPVVHFEDGDYKFWEVVTSNGERCLVFREMLGVVSLQERLDTWLREESGKMPTAGLKMIWADHIVPASVEAIGKWADGHPKQMKKFDIELNGERP